MINRYFDKSRAKLVFALIFCSTVFYFVWISVLTLILARLPYKGIIFYIFDAIIFLHKNFLPTLPYLAIRDGFTKDVFISLPIAALITFIIAGGGYLTHKRNMKRKNLYGSAEWSSRKELEDANFLSKEGIIVGKYNNQLLRFDSQEFGSLSAPTRSGKGVAIVIPNLLEWQNSIVILDVKQECFDITSKYRQDVLKQEVFLFNPFSFKTHRYNPLEYLDFNSPDIELQIQRIAIALYPTGNGGKEFFTLQAQSIFSAIVYLMGRLKEADLLKSSFTLTTLAGALQGLRIDVNGDEKGELTELKDIVETSYQMDLLTDTIYSKFLSFFDQEEAKDQFIGIKGSYEAPLKIFQDSLFEKATETNDFDFRDLRKKKISIYIGVTPDNISTAKPILNLFFTQLLFENIKQGLPDTNPELKHNVLLLMDEFTSIGFMSQYQLSITYLAGYNIRSLIIYQNSTQLSENAPNGYGDKGSETLLENHACQIIYRPKNPKTAEEISKRIGNITTNSNNNSMNSRDVFNVSRSVNQTQRPLILPQEIMDLKDDEQIIFYNRIKIKCKKAFFYSDPYFINKLKSVSPYLNSITGLPTKKELEKAYTNRETSIYIKDLSKNQ